jgi:hypothetical protein
MERLAVSFDCLSTRAKRSDAVAFADIENPFCCPGSSGEFEATLRL